MRRLTERSYLLRLWRDHARAPLRATLIAVGQPDERHHFGNLDELLVYLMAQASCAPQQDSEEVNELPHGSCE